MADAQDLDRLHTLLSSPRARRRQKLCKTDLAPMPKWYNAKRTLGRLDLVAGSMWTYFVGWKGGPVKIGQATDIAARMKTIQTSCPYRIHVWAMTGRSDLAEAVLHDRFEDHRLYGEWFEWVPEIEALMAYLNGAPSGILAQIRSGKSAERVQKVVGGACT